MNEREIFAAALEQPTEAERQAFLNEVCDDDMRPRIERLLKEQSQLGSFLEHPPLEADAGVLGGIAPTIVHGDGSTHGDEDKVISSGQREMGQNSQDPDDKFLLEYLEPATREDSLGRLGHYEILDVVGKGAFGTVLRAFDEKLERIVAIKVLAPEMASTSPARKRFLREARTSAAVRHENVVAIHAVEDDPIPYLVMEYIPGKTLQQRLDEQGPLDLPEALRLGKQIADGLASAHAEDLIHRDIKPGNILLEGGLDERVKITDFGLARAADDASMTQSGVIAGTPMYMAPEQAQGQKLDQRADLFSFGSVLYQMISGRPPFRARSTVAVLKRVAEETPRPIQEIIPEVPDWVCGLIGHLHAKNPDDRYGSAKEVSDLLARCLADVQAGRKPKLVTPSRASEVRGREQAKTTASSDAKQFFQRPLAKIAAVALLLLVGLVITETTGITNIASTAIRPATGSGTVAPEPNEPSIDDEKDGTRPSVSELALAFDGDGDYVVTPIEYDGTTPLTLEATVRLDRWPDKNSSEIVSNTHNGGVSLAASNRGFKFAVHNGDDYVHVEAPRDDRFLNRPVKLAGVVSSTKTIRLFVDGKLIDEKPLSSFHTSGEAFSIGTSPGYGKPNDGHQLEWTGQILEVRISNYPWYIKDYDATKPLKPSTHALALYRFDEGGGDILNDTSGKENHGKIVGAKWVGGDVSVDELMAEVRNEMKRRNPGFDATTLKYRVANGVVVHVEFLSDHVTDLSPLGSLPDLQSLDCSGSWDDFLFSKTGQSRLADLSPLQGLRLSRLDCNGTEVADVTPLKGMPLEHLSLAVTPVRDLSSIDPQPLTYLNLGRTQVSDVTLAHFQGCRTLKSLKLPFNQISDAGLANFHKCNELTTLGLYGTQVSDTGLALFQDCRNLTTLYLGQTEMTDEGLAYFKGCRNLTALYLGGTKVSDTGLAHFRDCKNWTALDLSGTNASDKGLALYFRDCQNLTHLDLSHTNVSDAGLAHFKDCKSLTTLVLNDTKVGDAGLAHFKDYENLTRLGLIKTNVTNEGLAHFKNCKNLVLLQLSWTKVGDAGLAHLKNCKNLTRIDLTRWRKSTGEEQVTDAGLAYFKDCKNLATLFLNHTHVSDAGLAHLQNCRNLTTLTLEGTKVSDLSQLKGMSLKSLSCDFQSDRDANILRSIKSLKKINGKTAAEFWKDFEALRRFASGEWIDLLTLVDPNEDRWDVTNDKGQKLTGRNEWRLENGELLVGYADNKDSKLIFPLDADWSAYEFDLEVTRRTGEQWFAINIPTSRRDCPLIFDAPGKAGIVIGGFPRPEIVAQPRNFKNGTKTRLRFVVKRGEPDLVTVWNGDDDDPSANWSGDCESLALNQDEGYDQPRRSSIYISRGSEFVFHKFRVRMLDGGTATTLRPGLSVPDKTIGLIPLIDGDQKKIRKENGLLVLRDEPHSILKNDAAARALLH